jgi:hypothetical protein
MEPEVIASIISAATALVAVIIGPLVTSRSAKKNMLGPMRQAWINNLRDTVTEFISYTHITRWSVVASISDNPDVQRTQEVEDRNRVQHVNQLKEKIALLINPKEEDHRELVRLLEATYAAYRHGEDTQDLLKAIRDQTQIVLKREWGVVKG